jgi:YesN/AraC family two-component response regulator
MKALIIDDERLARTELKRLLTPFKDLQVVGEAVNAEDALEKINELKPDLIFLDIQMPKPDSNFWKNWIAFQLLFSQLLMMNTR